VKLPLIKRVKLEDGVPEVIAGTLPPKGERPTMPAGVIEGVAYAEITNVNVQASSSQMCIEDRRLPVTHQFSVPTCGNANDSALEV